MPLLSIKAKEIKKRGALLSRPLESSIAALLRPGTVTFSPFRFLSSSLMRWCFCLPPSLSFLFHLLCDRLMQESIYCGRRPVSRGTFRILLSLSLFFFPSFSRFRVSGSPEDLGFLRCRLELLRSCKSFIYKNHLTLDAPCLRTMV